MEVRYWYTDGTVIEEHWYGWALLVGCFIQEHSCIQTFVLVSLLFLSLLPLLFLLVSFCRNTASFALPGHRFSDP